MDLMVQISGGLGGKNGLGVRLAEGATTYYVEIRFGLILNAMKRGFLVTEGSVRTRGKPLRYSAGTTVISFLEKAEC